MNLSKLVLAPMDGVLDAPLRQVLTSVNNYDYCESEFVRIIDRCILPQNLLKKVPELESGGITSSGTPVYVQFLGQDPEAIAESAALACKMGAPGIDLNFGCPARQVNKSNGGAALLKDPDLIYHICSAVRDAVPGDIPVTAKMRLGFSDTHNFLLIAQRIYSSGVNAFCVHGRTKVDEYLAGTVKWDLIGQIRKVSPVPVIANGDIFSARAAGECMKVTGCDALMLGRGALYIPNLANMIRNGEDPFNFSRMVMTVKMFMDAFIHYYPQRDPFPRLKQYLSYLREGYPEIQSRDLFRKICRSSCWQEGIAILEQGSE